MRYVIATVSLRNSEYSDVTNSFPVLTRKSEHQTVRMKAKPPRKRRGLYERMIYAVCTLLLHMGQCRKMIRA